MKLFSKKLENNFDLYKLGIVGVAILLIAIFCPILQYPIIGNVAPISFKGFMFDIIIICAVSLIILHTYIRKVWLALVGGFSFCINGYYLIKFYNFLDSTKANLIAREPNSNAARDAINLLAYQMNLKWGWLLLFSGSIILIVVGIKEFTNIEKNIN